jgi:hypothetical protein
MDLCDAAAVGRGRLACGLGLARRVGCSVCIRSCRIGLTGRVGSGSFWIASSVGTRGVTWLRRWVARAIVGRCVTCSLAWLLAQDYRRVNSAGY